jgi:hypothetical protein
VFVVFRHIRDLSEISPSNTLSQKLFTLQGRLMLSLRSDLGKSKFAHYCSFICSQRLGSMQLTFSFVLVVAARSNTDWSALANYTVLCFLNFYSSKYTSLSNHYFSVTRCKSAPATGRLIVAVCISHSSLAQEFRQCCRIDLRALVLFRSHMHLYNYPRCCCSHWRLRHNFGIHLDCIGHIRPDSSVVSYHMISFGIRAANSHSSHAHCITTAYSLVEISQD